MLLDVPSYRQHGREFPKSNPASRAGGTDWILKKSAKDLWHVLECLVHQSHPVARKSVGKAADITLVPASIPARIAPVVRKKRHNVSHTVESRDLPESERRLGLI